MQKENIMFKKIKNYFKKKNQESIINSIIFGYYNNGIHDDIDLYESQIRLFLIKDITYKTDKEIALAKGYTFNKPYPDDVSEAKKMFSTYRDNKNKNFLQKILETKISKQSLKIWLKFLPNDMLFEKDNNGFSPLTTSIIFKHGLFSILDEIGIKLDFKKVNECFRDFYDTKKGLNHIAFAAAQGDTETLKYFYEKHPEALHAPLTRYSLTALTIAVSNLQIKSVAYLVSKGAHLNVNDTKYKDMTDDLVSIIKYGQQEINKEECLEKNSLYKFLKKSFFPCQVDYKFRENHATYYNICTLSEKQLDALFKIYNLDDKKYVDKIIHAACYFNNIEFIQYAIKKELHNLDVKTVIDNICSIDECKMSFFINFINIVKDNIKDIIQQKDKDNYSKLYLLFKNKGLSITPEDIQWFKENNFNIFTGNGQKNKTPYSFLSEKSKQEAQKIYIEEFIEMERNELNKILSTEKTSVQIKHKRI